MHPVAVSGPPGTSPPIKQTSPIPQPTHSGLWTQHLTESRKTSPRVLKSAPVYYRVVYCLLIHWEQRELRAIAIPCRASCSRRMQKLKGTSTDNSGRDIMHRTGRKRATALNRVAAVHDRCNARRHGGAGLGMGLGGAEDQGSHMLKDRREVRPVHSGGSSSTQLSAIDSSTSPCDPATTPCTPTHAHRPMHTLAPMHTSQHRPATWLSHVSAALT